MAATLRSATSLISRCCRHAVNLLPVSSKCRLLQSSVSVDSRLPAQLHTSSCRPGLMDFFDDKKNWGEENVKTGRPWRVEELRIKSNSDLHKLWYVLLKERNMLLTMQHEYERQSELFPSPERIEKVEESMENIMAVVQERDEAYNLLETGKTGQPTPYYAKNFLGLRYLRQPREHLIPRHMNKTFNLLHPPNNTRFRKYIQLYYEKKRLEHQRYLQRERRRQKKLLEAFPHLKDKM